MTESPPRTFSNDFKRFFIRGLAILLPSVLTLWIVVKAYQFIDGAIAEPINGSVRLAMTRLAPWSQPLRTAFDPTSEAVDADIQSYLVVGKTPPDRATITQRLRRAAIDEWWRERWYMNFIGLVVAIVGVYVSGRLLGGYLGRAIHGRLERMIVSVPVFKQIYPSVKQVVDFLFSDDRGMKFSRSVLVEYPRKGLWSLGFVTGRGMGKDQMKTSDSVTVFIPSSPTPFTGYAILVPAEDIIEIPITVDEAVRFIVSGGVLAPDTAPSPQAVAHAVRTATSSLPRLEPAASESESITKS